MTTQKMGLLVVCGESNHVRLSRLLTDIFPEKQVKEARVRAMNLLQRVENAISVPQHPADGALLGQAYALVYIGDVLQELIDVQLKESSKTTSPTA